MSTPIASFPEFDRRLAAAMTDVDALAAANPDDRAIQSIKLQLEALHGWTRGGRKPAQDEKDRLNFGGLASRNVHELDARLAGELYDLESYVTYW